VDKLVLLERYNSHLIALERRAPLTAETYRYEIRFFLDWLEGEKLTLEAAGVNDVTRYLARRRLADDIDSRTAAKAISALRSFSRFLENEGLKNEGANNLSAITSLLQIPRNHDRLPEVHRKEDVDLLFSMIATESPLGARNRALYELIYSAGLRISEAVWLNTGDLFLSKNLARVRGKGSKERLVIFGPEAIFWLKHYLNDARPKLLGKRNSRALFLGKSGKRLSRKGIWKNYSALAAKAGLSTKLHTLRHTFATELLAGGAGLRSVQELLGHAEITTTQIYTHVDGARLRDSHRKYVPKLGALSHSEGKTQ
jgi:integrase/recombinase XerD